MSSFVLDMSGQRQIALTINDPAVTKAWAPAKQGDDVDLSLSGRELRIAIGDQVRIQRRRYVRSVNVRDDAGNLVKENGEYVYEKQPYDAFVLVIGGSASAFIRASYGDEERQAIAERDERDPATVFEQHPSVSVNVRRRADELHFLESGELVEEWTLGDLLPEA